MCIEYPTKWGWSSDSFNTSLQNSLSGLFIQCDGAHAFARTMSCTIWWSTVMVSSCHAKAAGVRCFVSGHVTSLARPMATLQ